MPQAMREILQKGCSYDEPDRMPDNLHISNLDIVMYVVAIIGHFVDLGLDINIAVRYFMGKKLMEFGWTLAFILLPAMVNTAVSVRMYALDKEQHSVTNEVTRRHWLRFFILALQLAPILRFTDALIYAIKSRRAENKGDRTAQRTYYSLMLKEDSDAALLRIFECFLEAAPQQLLQMSLLLHGDEAFTVHQVLSISSSIIGMGWCLAAYQRAVRFAQQDKQNMNWLGSLCQTLWHFLVTLSRITSLSLVAYLYPTWLLLACLIHILTMTLWLELCDKSPFCSQNRLAEFTFSLALGTVYLFTYILPIEGKTRYRYTVYYIICFLENLACVLVWYFLAHDQIRTSMFFYPLVVLGIVPYLVGLAFMLVYYGFLHPKVRKGVRAVSITYKTSEEADS